MALVCSAYTWFISPPVYTCPQFSLSWMQKSGGISYTDVTYTICGSMLVPCQCEYSINHPGYSSLYQSIQVLFAVSIAAVPVMVDAEEGVY